MDSSPTAMMYMVWDNMYRANHRIAACTVIAEIESYQGLQSCCTF